MLQQDIKAAEKVGMAKLSLRVIHHFTNVHRAPSHSHGEH